MNIVEIFSKSIKAYSQKNTYLILCVFLFCAISLHSQTAYKQKYEEDKVNFTASMGDADKKINFYVNKFTKDNYTDLKWTFGDNTEDTGYNPTHTYTNAGTYKVCLSVDGGANYTCKEDVFTITQTGLKVKYVNEENIMWPNGDRSQIGSPFTHRITSNGHRYDFHRALDIDGTHRDPVKAIADGKVRNSFVSSLGTEIITLEHTMDTPMYFHGKVVSAYYSRYLHLDERLVNKFVDGTSEQVSVTKGQIIGALGSTGSGNYKHNHLETRIGNYYNKISFDIGAITSQAHNLWHGELDGEGNQLFIDPEVNPLLFIEPTTQENKTLKYSILKDENTLYVKVYTNVLDNHFNEIGFKHNGINKPITLNYNTREGLPYKSEQGNGVDDYKNYNDNGDNTENRNYDYRNGIDDFDIYPVKSLSMRRNGLETIFRFDNVDFTNFKDDYSTPNNNFLYVKDIFGNLAEKVHNNIVINEVNFESENTSSYDYNGDGTPDFRDDFIEIVNNSDKDINLDGFKIFDKTRIDAANLNDLFDADNLINPRCIIPRYDADNDGSKDDFVILKPEQVLVIFTYIDVENLPAKYQDNNIIVLSVKENPNASETLAITQNQVGERIVFTNEQNGVLDIASNFTFSNKIPSDFEYSLVRNPELTGDFVLVDNQVATPGTFTKQNLSTEESIYTKNVVYPNPVKNKLFIINNLFNNYVIYDALGKQIKMGSIKSNTINVAFLKKGMYVVKIIKEDGTFFVNRIIKQ